MKNTFFDFKLFALTDADAVAGRSRGDNQRQVLVLSEDTGRDDEELESFLERMLKAAGLNLQTDISRLQLSPGEAMSLSGLRSHLPFSTVLVFGAKPGQLGLHLNIGKYHPLHHAGITYLFADQLSAIYGERQKGVKGRVFFGQGCSRSSSTKNSTTLYLKPS